MNLFKNRVEAGQKLAVAMRIFTKESDLLVLALPRGGVPVAFEVARELNAPLDVCIVRKLGVPGHEELAMGAISYGGGMVVNQEVVDALRIPLSTITQVAAVEMAELRRRESSYRKGRAPLNVEGKTLILVDDGLATGSTILAAIKVLRPQHPKKIIVGVPVTPASTFQEVRQEVDDMLCLMTPEPFFGVGQWYEDFSQTSDQEVTELLKKADTFGSPVLYQHDPQIS